jgi:hypothetical protein
MTTLTMTNVTPPYTNERREQPRAVLCEFYNDLFLLRRLELFLGLTASYERTPFFYSSRGYILFFYFRYHGTFSLGA